MTVVKAGPCVVTQVRTADIDGYAAVQIAFGAIDPRKVNKPQAGHFAKAGVTPRRHLVELRTDDATEYTLGQELTADAFEAGQRVDVDGHQQGQGLRRCHEAPRLPGPRRLATASQRKHRSPGSIGGCATPGRVFKGMRMAGRMGGVRTTTQNLTVHAVDAEKRPAAHQGRRPRPQRRPRPRPHRRQGRPREGG